MLKAGADPAQVIETFIRRRFAISERDVKFSRRTPLFESGYVDSIGVIELIAFIEDTFPVEIPEDVLLSGEFTTIDGIAAVVTKRLAHPAVVARTRPSVTVGEPQACAVSSRHRT